MITRRRVLADVGRLGLLAAAGPSLSLGQAPLLRRPIPKSGEMLPVVGLGTYRTFNVGGSPEELMPLERVTQLFLREGGRVVDSSPRYDAAEEIFGEVLRRVSPVDDLFVATKVDADGRDAGMRQMSASPGKMGVDRIDLMQVHNLRDWKTHLPTLKEWKARGTFRYIGISASRESLYPEFVSIMRSEPLDFVQINYSLGERKSEEVILPLAADRGMAVLVNRPFVAGELFSKAANRSLPDWAVEIDCASWAQLFLKFVLSHPAVTVALQATSDPSHLLDNMGAARGRLPDEAMRKRMLRLAENWS
jgi:diketogulonate reductase-like aldo/keto reductase